MPKKLPIEGGVMQARFVTLTAKPGRVDELAAFWDNGVVAQITAQAGNRGFFLLADNDSDRVIGLSLWDSADAADAAGATFRSHMDAVAHHLAAPPSAAAMHVAVASPVALTV
jgi:heme-degrading monooxygenase HmoA